MKKLTTSTRISDKHLEFFNNFKLNLIRAGGSEKSLKISYDEVIEEIVNYFKGNSDVYTKMIQEVAKNV